MARSVGVHAADTNSVASATHCSRRIGAAPTYSSPPKIRITGSAAAPTARAIATPASAMTSVIRCWT
jgi:hypothetical protein